MTKKLTKIQIDQPSVPLQVESEIKKSLQEEKSIEPSSSKMMNAEEATKVAIEFLKNFNIKKIMPNKVSNEGSRAQVELNLKGKKAAVLVDGKTKEIIEYEIETEKGHQTIGGSISIKLILVIVLIQLLLMILFDFIKPHIPLP